MDFDVERFMAILRGEDVDEMPGMQEEMPRSGNMAAPKPTRTSGAGKNGKASKASVSWQDDETGGEAGGKTQRGDGGEEATDEEVAGEDGEETGECLEIGEAGFDEIVAAMDDELGASKVGATFETLASNHPLGKGNGRDGGGASGGGGEGGGQGAGATASGDGVGEGEDEGEGEEGTRAVPGSLQDVDLDLNLLKNLIQSCNAQEGLAGPFSNLLGELGVDVDLPASTAEAMGRLDREGEGGI